MPGGQTLLSTYSTHKDATQMGPTACSIALWGGIPISKELSYNPKGLTSSLLISFSTIEIFSQFVVVCKINDLDRKNKLNTRVIMHDFLTEHERCADKYESRENA